MFAQRLRMDKNVISFTWLRLALLWRLQPASLLMPVTMKGTIKVYARFSALFGNANKERIWVFQSVLNHYFLSRAAIRYQSSIGRHDTVIGMQRYKYLMLCFTVIVLCKVEHSGGTGATLRTDLYKGAPAGAYGVMLKSIRNTFAHFWQLLKKTLLFLKKCFLMTMAELQVPQHCALQLCP